MGKKIMTNDQAVKVMQSTMAALKNRSVAELKDPSLRQAIAGTIAADANVDLESFSLDVGHLPDDKLEAGLKSANVLGNYDETGVSYGHGAVLTETMDFESFDALNTNTDDQIKLAAINVMSSGYNVPEDGIIALLDRETITSDSVGKELRVLTPFITVGAKNANGFAIGGEKKSLIANLDSRDIFGAKDLNYTPRFRSTGDFKTDDVLEGKLVSTISEQGDQFETAPFYVGKKAGLRRICSSEQYLTEYSGSHNAAITLAPDGGLNVVYLRLQNTDGSLENMIALKVAGENGTKYGRKQNSKDKDLIANYRSTQILKVGTLVSSGMLAYTTTADTYVLNNTADENLEIEVEFTVTATVNTDTMVFEVTAGKVSVVNIYDNSVLLETTSARYVELVKVFETASVHAVSMKHYLSNTNNLDNGMMIDLEAESFVIPAVYKPGATINKSILGNVPDKDIPAYLSTAKLAINSAKANEVLTMIDEFVETTRTKKDVNGVLTNYQTQGVGDHFIKPLVLEIDVNLTNINNMRSGEAKEDISRYMFDQITQAAIKAASDSNILKAIRAVYPGEKLTFVMVGGSSTVPYLEHALELEAAKEKSFDIQIESSQKVGNKVYCAFKLGTKVCEISPMIMVEAADHVYKGTQTNAGTVMDVTKVIPRRGIMMNTPVLIIATINGITDAFKKLS